MTTKYGLNIVFKMKTYAQLELDKPFQFKLKNLDFELSKIDGIEGTYFLLIKPITDVNHAKNILNIVKLALILFVLDINWSSIELDENIEMANILENPVFFNKKLIYGDYDLNRTSLFPLNQKLITVTSHPLKVKNLLNAEKIENNINKAFRIDSMKIINNEKLLLALEMYSQLSQFSLKRQYLDLVTILEILKPNYDVSDKSKENIENIKNHMKTIRNTLEKNSDEYREFDRYFTDAAFWQTKSINKSLQKFANEHQDEFEEYENIDEKIKKSYSIRSNIVHNGIIDEEFDYYHNFLKEIVGKLLKIIINEVE